MNRRQPEMSDANVPAGAALESLQQWFSRAISRPLLPGNAMRLEGIAGESLSIEAEQRIRAAQGVDGIQRLEIYNRQYWFRLITCMQSEYDCTVHWLGLDTFNAWVIRFLNAHPSDSPYLADLDRLFPDFLSRHLDTADRETVVEATRYDRAFSQAFDAPEGNPLRLETLQTGRLQTTSLQLAPHATPLWLRHDFKSYRALCRGDEDLTGKFPLKAWEGGVMVYRHGHTLYEKEISRAAWLVLDAFREPQTLSQLFENLEAQTSSETLTELEQNLATWFQLWVELGWIATAEEKAK